MWRVHRFKFRAALTICRYLQAARYRWPRATSYLLDRMGERWYDQTYLGYGNYALEGGWKVLGLWVSDEEPGWRAEDHPE